MHISVLEGNRVPMSWTVVELTDPGLKTAELSCTEPEKSLS